MPWLPPTSRWSGLSAAISWPQNQALFAVWLQKLAAWEHTTTPYLFMHTPDIGDSPQQAQKIWQQLRLAIPDLPAPPDWPEQDALF